MTRTRRSSDSYGTRSIVSTKCGFNDLVNAMSKHWSLVNKDTPIWKMQARMAKGRKPKVTLPKIGGAQ